MMTDKQKEQAKGLLAEHVEAWFTEIDEEIGGEHPWVTSALTQAIINTAMSMIDVASSAELAQATEGAKL